MFPSHDPARYFDELLKRKDLDEYNWIKARRENYAFVKDEHENDFRKMQKEEYRKQVTKVLERELENE